MNLLEAERELEQRLAAAGLSSASLDPWEGWKVFKGYLSTSVGDDVDDAGAFQCGHFEGPSDDAPEFCCFLVRQFSRREGDHDAPLRRLVMEFRYPAASMPDQTSDEVWTHDFATLAEFAAVVEGRSAFQAAMSRRPATTEVYSEEL